MKRALLKFLLFSFCAAPSAASASVLITEIMYDLEGSDGGFEWIEITNTGTEAVDVGAWRLFENGVNHKLTLFVGNSSVLAPQASAIIADKPDNFVTRFPGIEPVFDSAFSLSNTSETLMLKNAAGATADQVTYRSTIGAKGDGGSLHLEGEILTPALPNPGVYPGELQPVPVKEEGGDADSEALTASASGAYAAAAAAPVRGFSLLPWILGLVGIIGMGVAGALFVKAEQSKVTKSVADEFEIE